MYAKLTYYYIAILQGSRNYDRKGDTGLISILAGGPCPCCNCKILEYFNYHCPFILSMSMIWNYLQLILYTSVGLDIVAIKSLLTKVHKLTRIYLNIPVNMSTIKLVFLALQRISYIATWGVFQELSSIESDHCLIL